MNTITRIAANVTVATGLAAAALTLSTGAAHAETPSVPNTPNQFQIAPHVEPEGPKLAIPTPKPEPKPAPELPVADKPEPKPDPKPQFEGPDVITDTPDCTHGCGGNEVPDDKAPKPDQADVPTEDPANDAPLDQGCSTGCDLPEQDAAAPAVEKNVLTPSRIDAGQDTARTVLSTDQDESGLGYFVGLGLFSAAGATGIALAARRMNRKNA